MQGDQRISLREKIFREIIANMLIHREYTNAYPSTFIIYKNKVVAKNANKAHYFGLLTPNNVEPFPKNPDLARIFTQIGYSEELGTGIRNVFKYTKPYSGSDKIIFREEDIFVTEVPLKNIVKNNINITGGEKVGEKVGENFTNNQLLIIKYIKLNNKISAKELSEKIGISSRKIEDNIKKLKEKKKLKRIGYARGGHWAILENE